MALENNNCLAICYSEKPQSFWLYLGLKLNLGLKASEIPTGMQKSDIGQGGNGAFVRLNSKKANLVRERVT